MAGFQVGLTADQRLTDGAPEYRVSRLEEAGIGWRYLEAGGATLTAGEVDGLQAVIVNAPRVDAATLDGAEPPLVLARLGAGYDSIDVDACTARGVLVTTAPDGVRRPMASGAMALLLALAHRLPEKLTRARAGRWERDLVGPGLGGRVLGIVGYGSIGRDIASLARPFEMRLLAHNRSPRTDPGVEFVDLETLLTTADYVIATLPATPETQGLFSAERLALMKPSACFINIGRGQTVDEPALAAALAAGRLAGAALDVFSSEPLDPGSPLTGLDNVIVTPHAIGLTREMLEDVGDSACRSVLAIADGRVPATVINPEALAHPRLRGRLTP
jgi:phosphoglycerate dehydrogenase-like enzyme